MFRYRWRPGFGSCGLCQGESGSGASLDASFGVLSVDDSLVEVRCVRALVGAMSDR